jgi:tetratricopeptide (TPR) repeat protein
VQLRADSNLRSGGSRQAPYVANFGEIKKSVPMMLGKKCCRVGLLAVVLTATTFFDHLAFGQDAAWEGLINAGRTALQQKNFSEAERHFEAALEAAERFPSGDARLGKSYNNLAAVYYAQEDYERAEPLMRRALAQLREAIGPENTDVAQTMKNLAALYYLQGNRSEAEALLKQSLTILEKVHGPNHAFVATVLSNLAGLYQAEDRYQDAEPLLTRSLKIWESLLGAEHPDVIRSRRLLAQVREARGGEAAEIGAAAAQTSTPTQLIVPAEGAANVGREDVAENTVEKTAEKTEELAEAEAALAALTEPSPAQGTDQTGLGGVPAPTLNPIGDLAQAASETTTPALGGDQLANALPGEPSDAQPPTSGPATPPLGALGAARTQEQAQEQATALLESAPSAADVSFSVYLSTLWSVDEARRYWQAMQDAMPELLQDKELEIEAVAAADGDDPFYRVLTVPFLSDTEAEAACEAIKSKLRTHDCTVVVRDKTADG